MFKQFPNHSFPASNLKSVPCPTIDANLSSLTFTQRYRAPNSRNDSTTADGVRKEERKCISQILTNISSMRDNVYSLHRHVWNDVQEDWPFYTEQERQILKRS